MKRQPTGLTKEVCFAFTQKLVNIFKESCLNNLNFPTFDTRTLQMFAEGKRLMVKREMWTVSQAWEAPGDFF